MYQILEKQHPELMFDTRTVSLMVSLILKQVEKRLSIT